MVYSKSLFLNPGFSILTLILLLALLTLHIIFPLCLHLRPTRSRRSTSSAPASPNPHAEGPREKLSSALKRDSRTKPLQPGAFLLLSAACFLSIVTAVWQHVGAISTENTIRNMGAAIAGAEAGSRVTFPGPGPGVHGNVSAAVGRRTIALGWGAAAMIVLAELFFFAGILWGEKARRLVDEVSWSSNSSSRR